MKNFLFILGLLISFMLFAPEEGTKSMDEVMSATKEAVMKEKNTAWILLVVSGLMEIVWAYTMKLSHGFTVLWPSVITIAILIISFFLLAKAVNTLGIGLSYAVFTGIGVVGTTFISIFVLKEGASLLKMLSLGVLIIGILGLKLCDKEGEAK